MTKAELISEIYGEFEGEVTKKTVAELVDSVFKHVAAAIKREQRFSYAHFGTFMVRKRKPRKGHNPQTGQPIKIKATKTVGFKIARAFKAKL